jgi:hypothetical protein
MLPMVMRDASLSHATGVNQPLRFFKRFVRLDAIELDRNQIKRLVLACRFDLTAIGFGRDYRPLGRQFPMPKSHGG